MIQKKSTTRLAIKQVLGLVLVSSAGWGSSYAADAPAAPSYTRAPMTAYTALMNDALTGNPYEKPVWNLHDVLKLPDWLTVGLENRTRYEGLGGTFKPGVQGGDQVIAIQSDLWIQAQLGKFRIATEFMDSRGLDADKGSYINNNTVDTVDFIQAYASWADKNAFSSNLGVEVKVGRQTMDLGSRRLVARPVYRNTVNSFTGVRLRVLDNAKWQLNSFATLPVVRFPTGTTSTSNPQMLNDVQAFDQEATRTWFSGGILEGYNLVQNVNSEIYLYNLDEADSWNNPTHKRRYFTPGLRFYIKPSKGNFDFQAEGMGQFGTVRNKTTDNVDRTHQAWSEHIEAGYSFDMPWSPRFFLEYDYASGSRNQSSGTDSRFDPLYAASDLDFGATGIYSAFQRSNINSPGYKFDFAPRSDLSFRLQQRMIWLASANDCWGGASCFSSYVPVLQANKAGTSGSFVGNQLGFSGRYNFNSSLNFEAGWFHLFKGQFAKQGISSLNGSATAKGYGVATPGDDTDYFFVQSMLRF